MSVIKVDYGEVGGGANVATKRIYQSAGTTAFIWNNPPFKPTYIICYVPTSVSGSGIYTNYDPSTGVVDNTKYWYCAYNDTTGGFYPTSANWNISDSSITTAFVSRSAGAQQIIMIISDSPIDLDGSY